MDSLAVSPSEKALADLVHDLRQPISNIGLSASYLEMLLGAENERALEQVQNIQEQVERTACMLNEVAADLLRRGVQRARDADERRDLTKSQTAAVS